MEVAPNDLWIMAISTVRYSMGRSTYMSSMALELVIRYEKDLHVIQLHQIANEVAEALRIREESNSTLGMQMDHDAWKEWLGELRRVITRREKEDDG